MGLLSVAISALICAALVNGLAQPPGLDAQPFHMHNCPAPCVMGLTVGKTTYAETQALFQAQAALTHLEANSPDELSALLANPDGSADDYPIPIEVTFSKGIVESVRINAAQWSSIGMPTLIDLMLAYGLPTCAFEDAAAGNHLEDIYILNKQQQIQVYIFSGYGIDWQTPIWEFAVSPYHPDENPCQCLTWHGPTHIQGMGGPWCPDDWN
jgi:hypothetical protein